MKKLLAFLLFCPALTWASFQPVTGSTLTVYAPIGGALNVATTGFAYVPAATAQPVTSTSTYLVNLATVTYNGIAQPVTSTSTYIVNLATITHNGIGQPVTSTSTYIVNNSTVQVTNSTAGVVNGGSTLYTYTQNLTSTTFAGVAQPVTSTSTYLVNLASVTFNGIGMPVTSTSIYVVNNTTVQVTNSTSGIVNGGTAFASGGIVSSTTLSLGLTQGATTSAYYTSIGQALMTGIPYHITSSTYSVNVSSNINTELVIISSATAPNYIYLCGCVFNNSSATNSFVTLYQSSSTVAGRDAITIGTPANDVPVGIWPGCTNPFFRSLVGGQITIKANAIVTSTTMRCQYYSGP